MLIIADARMPAAALDRLAHYGEVITLSSRGITYEAISGHPDIFFCNTPQGLVYAPNAPAEIIDRLRERNVPLIEGHRPVGGKYPATARYNAFVNRQVVVHHPLITDENLARALHGRISVEVKQGYTRCNLVEVAGLYITGDEGIRKALQQQGLDTFKVSQKEIVLPGCAHGFFGGCTGVQANRMFVCGSLSHLPEGGALAEALEQRGAEIIPLYEGPLFDAGSILMIEERG